MAIQKYTPMVPVYDSELIEDPISQTEYEKMKGAMPSFRDLMVIKCLRSTGLRISELLAITPARISDDGVQLEFKVKRGKKKLKDGDQARYERMPLPPELSVEMRDFIKGQGLAPGDAIFRSHRGPLGARQIRNIFNDAGIKSIGRPVHPHEFRGLYISDLIERGLPIEAVAKMVGHEDIRTTQKWYYKLTSERRREIQMNIPA